MKVLILAGDFGSRLSEETDGTVFYRYMKDEV